MMRPDPAFPCCAGEGLSRNAEPGMWMACYGVWVRRRQREARLNLCSRAAECLSRRIGRFHDVTFWPGFTAIINLL